MGGQCALADDREGHIKATNLGVLDATRWVISSGPMYCCKSWTKSTTPHTVHAGMVPWAGTVVLLHALPVLGWPSTLDLVQEAGLPAWSRGYALALHYLSSLWGAMNLIPMHWPISSNPHPSYSQHTRTQHPLRYSDKARKPTELVMVWPEHIHITIFRKPQCLQPQGFTDKQRRLSTSLKFYQKAIVVDGGMLQYSRFQAEPYLHNTINLTGIKINDKFTKETAYSFPWTNLKDNAKIQKNESKSFR